MRTYAMSVTAVLILAVACFGQSETPETMTIMNMASNTIGDLEDDATLWVVCGNDNFSRIMWERKDEGPGTKTPVIMEIGLGSTGKLNFKGSNAEDLHDFQTYMTITPEGNVGIGRQSPSEMLMVGDRIRADGGFVQHNAIVPDDIWAKPQLYLKPAGFIGTQGSHGVDISWNGYRNNTDGTFGWLGINDRQEASSISLNQAGILFWADEGLVGDFRRTARMAIKNNGNVGIGTTNPIYKLDVQGDVQASAYHTGDIFFQKDGKKLWRMFEDEAGLYVENLTNGRNYGLVLEELADAKSTAEDSIIVKLKAQNAALEQRVAALEAKLTMLAAKVE